MDYGWIWRVYKARPALRWRVYRARPALHCLLLVLAMGCATKRPPDVVSTPSPASSDNFTRLIRHGCYRCLEQAFADARTRGATHQAFEAAALLVLRSKELGLPTEPWLGHARALAAADNALSAHLAMVEAIPPHPMSDDRDALFDIRGRTQARTSMTAWRETLRSEPGSDIFRMYLDVALICGFGTLKQDDQSYTGRLDEDARAPIYQYPCRHLRQRARPTPERAPGQRRGIRRCRLRTGSLCARGSDQPGPGGGPAPAGIRRRGISPFAGDRRDDWQRVSPMGGVGGRAEGLRRGHRGVAGPPGGADRPGDQLVAPRAVSRSDCHGDAGDRRRPVASGRGLLLARLEPAAPRGARPRTR